MAPDNHPANLVVSNIPLSDLQIYLLITKNTYHFPKFYVTILTYISFINKVSIEEGGGV